MTIPHHPPPPTAPAVREHRRAVEARLEQLKASVPAGALASARGEPGAIARLGRLQRQIAGLEFEIAANLGAYELAEAEDRAAHAAWRAAVHAMAPGDVLEGLGKESCPVLCQRGVPAGCVISGGCLSVECFHPRLSMDSFYIADSGKKLFTLRSHGRASQVFAAAAKRLKVEDRFA